MKELRAPKAGMAPPQRGKTSDEAAKIPEWIKALPVEPGCAVVLTVGIVVAALGPPHLVSANQHRRTETYKQRGQHRPRNAVTHRFDRRVIANALRSEVDRKIVTMTIEVVFFVCLIVPLRVAKEISEREAIVRGDEIDRSIGSSPVVVKHLWRSHKRLRQFWSLR